MTRWTTIYGKVAALDGSPFANGQTATCWIEMSAEGRYAFVVNTATPSMTSYSIARQWSIDGDR